MASRASDLLRASAMVVAGLVGGALFRALFRSEPRPAVVRDARAHEASPPPRGAANDDELRELRRRVAAVEAATVSPSSAREAPGSVPTAGARVERPSLEQMRVFHEEHHASLLRAHLAQPVDPAWAQGANSGLAKDLAAAGQDKFTTTAVDCRMTTCTAKVQWENYEAATKTHADVVAAPLGMACRRDILLPQPADPAAKYEATAFFDCEEARVGGR